MKQMRFDAKSFFAALLLASCTAFAGNVPQYEFSRAGVSAYQEFTDGIVLDKMEMAGTSVLYGDGTMNPNKNVKFPGFDLGFKFKLGGQEFDCVAIGNDGNLYFGKDGVVDRSTAFNAGMSTIYPGLNRGTVSYKVTGEAGNKVFHVQYKDCQLAENTNLPKGRYSLQIRLYEANGRIEFAFKEIRMPNMTWGGFRTGISGWDDEDYIWLYSPEMDGKLTKTDKPYDMLSRDTYIHWTNNRFDDEGDDVYYNPEDTKFAIYPSTDNTVPENAPEITSMIQTGTELAIKVKRAEGAAETVVLLSDEPFTEADLPKDGTTFRGGLNTSGVAYTTIGLAQVLYYGPAEEININYPGLEPGKDYYIRAISANGYPMFNNEKFAQDVYKSTQAAPSSLRSSVENGNKVTLTWTAENPVIVASTNVCEYGYQVGYRGTFGQPNAQVKVGDEITGGGKVIYVGDAKTLQTELQPNEMTYFRAWTVKDGVVSSTSANTNAIADPTIPFEPNIERYPLGLDLLGGWEASASNFVPMQKIIDKDNFSYGIKAISFTDEENGATMGTKVYLRTPELDLSKKARFTFLYAMETKRPPIPVGNGQTFLPQSNKPGDFGKEGSEDKGALEVFVDGERYLHIDKYEGTMTSLGGDVWVDNSSTYVPVVVELPALGANKRIEIRFQTVETSWIWTKEFKVEYVEGEAVPVTGVTLNHTVYELDMDDPELKQIQLEATVLPENATMKALSWTSSDGQVAVVNENGLVTAQMPGVAIITAESTDGSNIKATCRVTVKGEIEVPVTAITLDQETLQLDIAKAETSSAKLVATVTPENATNTTVFWVSSDDAVATVNNEGVVTGHKNGSCVITAEASDGSGVKATCNVTVIGENGIYNVIADDAVFEVYDVQGRVLNANGNAAYLKNLDKGIYIIRLGDKVIKISK